MPTITPIAYNTGSPIPGTTQYGDLAVGTGAQDYGAFPSGYRFWATPDQDLGYVIARTVPANTQPTPVRMTWDPNYVGTLNALSSGNTVITNTGANSTVLASRPLSGKMMFSIRVNIAVNGQVGFGRHDMNIGSYLGSNDGKSVGFDSGGYYYFYGGTQASGLPTWGSVNDVVDVAIDTTANSAWIRVNGGLWNNSPSDNPATGASIIGVPIANLYPGVTPLAVNIQGRVTLLSEPVYSVPAGYEFLGQTLASVGFLRTGSLTEGSFIDLAQYVSRAISNDPQNFSTGSQAKTWLESNGYWTSYTSGPSLLASFDASNPSSYPGTGTTWFDISGNGNDGGIVGATFSSGGVGGTFNFSGSNQYVTIGAPIPNASSYTIAAWVNAAAVGGAHNIVSSNSSPFWVNAGTLYGGTTGNYTWVSSPGFPTGLWKYVAYTFDDANNTATLYINGSQVNQNLSATSTYASEPTYIGSHFAGSPVSFWNGQIAEVRIWDGALTSTGILSDYNSTKTRFGL